MLSIHLARFGGFISRAQSRAGSTFVSPMNSFMNMSASQNVANQTEYAAGKSSGSPVNRRISELKKSSNPGSPKIPVPKISVTDPETGFEKPLKDDVIIFISLNILINTNDLIKFEYWEISFETFGFFQLNFQFFTSTLSGTILHLTTLII